MTFIKKCSLLVLSTLLVACGEGEARQAAEASAPAASDLTESQQRIYDDVTFLCAELPRRYYYFAEKKSNWAEACAIAKDEVALTANWQERLVVLERLIDELYDNHMSFGTNSEISPYLIPTGMDVMVAPHLKGALITAVRQNSVAAASGVQAGMVITNINNVPLFDIAQTRMRTGGYDDARFDWAYKAAVAGYRGAPRKWEILDRGEIKIFDLPAMEENEADSPLTVEEAAQGIYHFRFNNSLGNDDTASAFIKAFAAIENPKGIIIDLRDTPSGGNTSVAEPILGLFIETEKTYQVTVYPDGEEYLAKPEASSVSNFDVPVMVLVGPWTGSMGEGMAIGFSSTKRGIVMGQKMAGLAGGTENIELPNAKISLWVPTYDLRHVDGTPRHIWRPEIENQLGYGHNPDVLLGKAIEKLKAASE